MSTVSDKPGAALRPAPAVPRRPPPPTVEQLYAGARTFSASALQAHHTGDFLRLTIDAGTALEHITKACLTKRSPALLVELQRNGYNSLVALLGFAEAQPKPLRTIGIRIALERIALFITSNASQGDLQQLADHRDGTVHLAQTTEVEERLLTAFFLHVDACIDDLGEDRACFWGDQQPVVDLWLSNQGDKVVRRVEVKIASAKAWFSNRYSDLGTDARRSLLATPVDLDPDREAQVICPACEAKGVATGRYDVQGESEYEGPGESSYHAWWEFEAQSFRCPTCMLRLDNRSELAAAAMELSWAVDDSDQLEYLSDSSSYDYEFD